MPISIRDGLPYVTLCQFTDGERVILPHVILTGDADCNPGILDLDLDDNKTWFDAISDLPLAKPPSAFDEVGDYTKRVVVQSHDVLYSWDTCQHIVDACVMMHTYETHLVDPASNKCLISDFPILMTLPWICSLP